jgi:hypothetical protein
MGPPSYMLSVVDRNVVIRRIPAFFGSGPLVFQVRISSQSYKSYRRLVRGFEWASLHLCSCLHRIKQTQRKANMCPLHEWNLKPRCQRMGEEFAYPTVFVCRRKKNCFLWRCGRTQAMVFSFTRFLDHRKRRIRVGRIPLDEWSARRRDLYLTAHNFHMKRTSMPPAGFEPAIQASEWPRTHALDRAANGTGV